MQQPYRTSGFTAPARIGALPRFGETCLHEVRQLLAEHGLSLAPPRAQPCGPDRVIAAPKDRRCPLTRREATVLELTRE